MLLSAGSGLARVRLRCFARSWPEPVEFGQGGGVKVEADRVHRTFELGDST